MNLYGVNLAEEARKFYTIGETTEDDELYIDGMVEFTKSVVEKITPQLVKSELIKVFHEFAQDRCTRCHGLWGSQQYMKTQCLVEGCYTKGLRDFREIVEKHIGEKINVGGHEKHPMEIEYEKWEIRFKNRHKR